MNVICSRFDRCPQSKICPHAILHQKYDGCLYHPQCSISRVSIECVGLQLLDSEQQVKLTLREL